MINFKEKYLFNISEISRVSYRGDVPTLRAIAVIAVVLFHFNANWLPGGFAGVDVFFVISGYLITNVILSDLDTGCFSFSDFYERRARRILPALFFVVVVSFSAAWFLLLPPYMKDFSQSLVSTSLFSSNILFMLQNDYFDSSAHLKPLLHTWSLSVEEQFYLVLAWFILPVFIHTLHMIQDSIN